MTDILIVGAGPAGLTAAVYACRAGMQVTVFDKNLYGGQAAITKDIENFPAIDNINGAVRRGTLCEADRQYQNCPDFSRKLSGAYSHTCSRSPQKTS